MFKHPPNTMHADELWAVNAGAGRNATTQQTLNTFSLVSHPQNVYKIDPFLFGTCGCVQRHLCLARWQLCPVYYVGHEFLIWICAPTSTTTPPVLHLLPVSLSLSVRIVLTEFFLLWDALTIDRMLVCVIKSIHVTNMRLWCISSKFTWVNHSKPPTAQDWFKA